MKYAKKLVGLLVALVMVLAMSVSTFAADTYTYEIYQIFTGDFANGILSNVKWGANAKIPAGSADSEVPEAILNELTGVNSKSDSEKLEVIQKYVDLTSTGQVVTLAKDADDKYTQNGLEPGYYLIKDNGTITGNDVSTTYVAKVTDGTLTFQRKGTVPEVDKKIVENDKVDTNEVSIGDTVQFEITGTLPSNIDDYKEYTYIFTDILSKGLTFTEDSVEVKVVNGTAETSVTKYFYIADEKNGQSGETTLKVGISNLKALKNSTDPQVTLISASKIVVTYSATLNENAVIAGEGNDNKVKLAYSNDPNNSGTGTQDPPPEDPKDEPTNPKGETPEKTTKTYTTELTISKTDEKQQILTGAEFTLSGSSVNVTVITGDVYAADTNGAYWKLKDGTYTTDAPAAAGGTADNDKYDSTTIKYTKKTEATVVNGTGTSEKSVSAYVDRDGKVTFSGLGAGTYTITETVTPAGYNTMDPIEFTLTFDAGTKTFGSGNPKIVVGGDNMLDAAIENHSGSTLPSTGGMGTTIFYIVGAVLVIGAGALLILLRSKSSKK